MSSTGEIPGAALGSRALFPSLRVRAYLAHAAMSPTPEPVAREVSGVLERFAETGIAAFFEARERTERAADRFAALVGGGAGEVARMPNTSAGLIAVASGLRWRAGDRLCLFEGEFPANTAPWLAAAREHDLEVVRVPAEAFRTSPAEGLERTERELARGVRLVAVSAVQFQSGLAMPLTELGALCRRHGALLCVDGIQAVGATPLDVRAAGVHFLGCGGHKWLMGPLGTAFLWISPDVAGELDTHAVGWMSLEDPEAFLFAGGPAVPFDAAVARPPRSLEVGVLNLAGLAGVGVAMELLAELGVSSIHAHVNDYLDRVEDAALDVGYESLRSPERSGRSTILALRPPAGVELRDVLDRLTERGCCVTTPDGVLRIAPHWPNPLEEADEVGAALAEALRGR